MNENKKVQVRVRIAPSPTGDPHVGTAYVGLFNYVFARANNGKFILRIEDTDRARSTKESEQAIFKYLHWLGIRWDEGPDVDGPFGPYRQSERSDIYSRHAEELIRTGHAYYCFCTPERLDRMRKEQMKGKESLRYDGKCRELSAEETNSNLAKGMKAVIRLKVPNEGETSFQDLIRGRITIEHGNVDDQVLIKSDGFPTYHLANVVDDHLMEITHVIRAEEWISSVPKHVMLYQAFGWELPVFIHMPLLRNADRSKISKRKNPVSLEYYQKEGFLPEAMLNFLALMGWSTGEDEEVFSLNAMIQNFSWERVSISSPVFDLQKLEWLNGIYIRELSPEAFKKKLKELVLKDRNIDEKFLDKLVPLIQERMRKLTEFDQLTDFFFAVDLKYDPALLIQKKKQKNETVETLKISLATLEKLMDWQVEGLEEAMRALCGEIGWKPKDVFMTLRIAVTGKTQSPPLFETMEVLGRKKSLARIRSAIELLSKK